MRSDKKSSLKSDKKTPPKVQKKGAVGYNKKSALLEDAITQMNAGKYGRASSALKELLALDPHNAEARRLFATLHLKLGSLMSARTAFESLAREALERQDYWLAESLLREYLIAGPRCVPFLEMLGHVYEEKGDAMAAVAEYGKAVEVLLEDLDPDNPNRASDLFAKIRELAPASPVAFRFAAMFDATTGQLLQPATPAAAIVPSDSVPSSESHAGGVAETVTSSGPEASALAGSRTSEQPAPNIAEPSSTAEPTPSETTLQSTMGGMSNEVMASESPVSTSPPPSTDLPLETPPFELIAVEPPPSPPAITEPPASAPSAMEPVHIVAPLVMPWEQVDEAASPPTTPAAVEPPAATPPDVGSPTVAPALLAEPSSEPIATAPVSPSPMPWDQIEEVSAQVQPSPAPESASSPEAHIEPTGPSLELIEQPSPFPIAEAPATPTPMPWDQVQESSIAVPPPTDSHAGVRSFDVPVEPAVPAAFAPSPEEADQAIPPVPSGTAATALSWDEILKAVDHLSIGSTTTTESQPPAEDVTREPVPPVEPVALPPVSTHAEHVEVDHQIESPTGPAGESALDAPSLSAPMPWEQVEHDTVTIPRREREPEFGSMPVITQPGTHDPTLILQAPFESHETPTVAELEKPAGSTAVPSSPEPELRILSLDTPVAPVAPVEQTIHIPPAAFEPAEETLSVAQPEPEPILGPEASAGVEATPVAEASIAPAFEAPLGSLAAVADAPSNLMPAPEVLPESPAAPIEAPAHEAIAQVSTIPDAITETVISPTPEPVSAPTSVLEVASSILESPPTSIHLGFPAEPAAPVIAGEQKSPQVETPSAALVGPPEAEVLMAPEPGPPAAEPPMISEPSVERSAPALALKPEPAVVETPQQVKVIAQVEVPSATEPVLSVAPPSPPSEPPSGPIETAGVSAPQIPVSESPASVATEFLAPEGLVDAEQEEDSSKSKGSRPRSRKREDSIPAPPPPTTAPPAEPEVERPLAPAASVTTAEPAAVVEPTAATPEAIAPPLETVAAAPQPAAESTATAPPSAPASDGGIRILWNDSSGRTTPSSSSAGMLGRWLKKSKDKPAEETPKSEDVVEESTAATSSATRREAAAAAVDVLFDRATASRPTPIEDSVAKPRPRRPIGARAASRARMALTILLGTCFSTTRSLVLSVVALAGLALALAAMVVGAAGVTWVFLEEQPNAAYHNMTSMPQRTLQDSSKNGYFMLLGFNGPINQDPVLAGYERKVDESDAGLTRSCLAGDSTGGTMRQGASADVLGKWFRGGDPAAQMKTDAAGVKSWIAQADVSMSRYRRWLKMPFEDWGYGEGASPNCGLILYAHRLYVAEGFAQDQEVGVERLEGDLGAWRAVLGHAKTLPVKMLASTAMDDDIAVISGLLLRPDLDERLIGRLAKMARPLDQVEQSMRWPMQSQFVLATKSVDQALKQDKTESRPFYVSVAAAMPLPKQRRFNDYAEYYEAAGKAASEGRYGNIPKRSQFVRTPADGVMDYLVNPIENVIGLEPLPAWETYGGRILETDARLRLAGLQAWLRRTPPEQDLLTRLAKAGQTLYDPFTGLPMLVNLKRGLFYSVGQDLKDNDANAPADVVAQIPFMPGQDTKRSGKAK